NRTGGDGNDGFRTSASYAKTRRRVTSTIGWNTAYRPFVSRSPATAEVCSFDGRATVGTRWMLLRVGFTWTWDGRRERAHASSAQVPSLLAGNDLAEPLVRVEHLAQLRRRGRRGRGGGRRRARR